MISDLKAEIKNREKDIKDAHTQLKQVSNNQGEFNQEIQALNAELLTLKKQLQDVSFEKGKLDFKLQTTTESLDNSQ